MRGVLSYSLAFVAGALLALPPSACCLIGHHGCCTQGVAAAQAHTPHVRSCCQRRAEAVPSQTCCQHQGKQAPQAPQMCCCVRTAVPADPLVKVAQPASFTLFAVVEPVLVSAAANFGIRFAPFRDVSPPLHVRLCVWRC